MTPWLGGRTRGHSPLHALPLLSRGELHQLLTEWIDDVSNTVDVVASAADTTIHGLFAQQAARNPERLALVAGRQRLSYGELERRSAALAARVVKSAKDEAAGAGAASLWGK